MYETSVATTRTRRISEERQYRLYYALGFITALPVVALSRLVPRRRGTARSTVLEETHAHVHNVLAFVFMA
ncbi:MAG: hypothetical protein AAGD10_02240 [Myxococcota bacterium]